VHTLALIGNVLKTAGKMTVVGAAHLVDPIPGAPIGRSAEVLMGAPKDEAFAGIHADAECDYAVSQSMAAGFAGFPMLQAMGGVVGKVFRNIGRAGRGVQRVLHAPLLRKVETRLAERAAHTESFGVDRFAKSANRNMKLHKNDSRYIGPTHIYQIVEKETGQLWKIGESARGLNAEGLSIRAEEQVRKLRKETGRRFESVVIETLNGKTAARARETELIKNLRVAGHTLPGNKGVH
jgi:hypothetical protein